MMPPGDDLAACLEYLDDCTTMGIRRRALLVHLPASLKRPLRPALRRLLAEHLAPFAEADRSRLFRLPRDHLLLAWRAGPGDGGSRLDRAAVRLADLLAEGAPSDAGGTLAAITLCHLPEEVGMAREFLNLVAAEAATDATQPPPGKPLTITDLAALEAALVQADVARFVRRRSIWRWADGRLALQWEHRYLDLADLAADLAPGLDLTAAPWLLRRLTRMLERRMLALLADPLEIRAARPFLLDLGVAAILDPVFLRFDAALPRVLRGNIALRLSPADLLADPGNFQVARDVAQARGYQLMLGGGAAALALFPPARSRLDLAELGWSERASLMDLPASQTMLTGLDLPDSLAWSRGQGIGLLAGAAADAAARMQ